MKRWSLPYRRCVRSCSRRSFLSLAQKRRASPRGWVPARSGDVPPNAHCPKRRPSTPRTADGRPDMQGYWERAFTSQDIEEHAAGLAFRRGPAL
jgi:hypothetical protein